MQLDFQPHSKEELHLFLSHRKKERKTTFTWYWTNKVISLWFNQWTFFAYIKMKDALIELLVSEWISDGVLWDLSLDVSYPHAFEVWAVPERVKNKWLWEEKNEKWIENSYYVHAQQPLQYEESVMPIKIKKVSELYDLIKEKSFAFYTWAGVSITSIPWMDQLKKQLQIEDNNEIDWLLRNLLINPKITQESW